MSLTKHPEVKSFETDGIEKDERWLLTQKVVSSATFAKSPRLCQFLSYIAYRTILERQFEVNEQQIGVHVFDRTPNYNASEDNIVRSQARLLRKKLDDYYSAEGQADGVRIIVPRGGYVPVFETVQIPVAFVAPPPQKRIGRIWWIAAASVAVVTVAGWLVYTRFIEKTPEARYRQFWNQIANNERASIIVPSDTALVLYQNYAGRTVSLNDYVRGQFAHGTDIPADVNPKLITSLDSLPYTNLVDLNFSWQLARRSKADLRRTNVRAPRDLRASDLKGVNAILIGARRANPWVELFDKNNTFQGLYDPESRDYVSNRGPEGSEPSRFLTKWSDGSGHAYAIVAFLPGLTGQENVLLLSGTSTPGTEGAADFVLSDRSLGGFLEKIMNGATHVPHFELVLEVETISTSAPRAKVVAYRVRKD